MKKTAGFLLFGLFVATSFAALGLRPAGGLLLQQSPGQERLLAQIPRSSRLL